MGIRRASSQPAWGRWIPPPELPATGRDEAGLSLTPAGSRKVSKAAGGSKDGLLNKELTAQREKSRARR